MTHSFQEMRRSGSWLSIVVFMVGCVATALLAQSGQPQAGESTQLEIGKTIERELAGGQSHDYRFTLEAGEYANVSVEPISIFVAIEVFGPDGEKLFEINNPSVLSVPSVQLIGATRGTYRVRIMPAQASAPAGRYQVMLREIEVATEKDKSSIAGSRATVQGLTLWLQQTRTALLDAATSFEEAVTHWRRAEDPISEANTLSRLGLLHVDLGDQPKALDYATKALAVAQASKDRGAEAGALDAIGFVHLSFGDRRKAVEYFDQVLILRRATGDRAGEGTTLNNLGIAHFGLGELRKALEYFDLTVEVYRELHDRRRSATAANNIGVILGELGDYQAALESYQRALALHRELGNRAQEAIALNNIGTAYSSLAEYQKGLDAYRAALDIDRSLDKPAEVALNTHNIARAYASLGDRQRAVNLYQEAVEILRGVKDQFRLANSLNSLGDVHAEQGDPRKALEFHNEALALRRAVHDAGGEAASLDSIGTDYAKLGERERARDHFDQAVVLLRKSGNLRQLAGVLKNLGSLDREVPDQPQALKSLEEALQINRTIHDRRGEADVLAELAKLERDRNDFLRAHERANQALTVLESLRLTVASPTLRASFFAAARDVQELDIDALMQLHAERSGEGFSADALFASERGRARSLLEMLGESGTGIRGGVDAGLLERERELERLISGKAEQQTKMLDGPHTEAAALAASKELDALTAELEQIQGRIRQTSPQYAALTQPAPLNLRDIQTKVLDNDTVLLQYSLGANKSFLWAVTPTSLDVFALPPRAEVESAAKRAYELLTARNQKPPKETAGARTARLRRADADYPAAAGKVSRTLLGPVASLIQSKRLLIVGEGVLLYLPFAALPEPGADPGQGAAQTPLILKHEIVTAPSASVVAVLRQQTAGRKPAEKTLAVLADPVFTANDARLAAHEKTPVATSDVGDRDGQELVRLRFSRSEAEEISRLVPAASTLKALDFDASRDTVLSPDFGRHRIVHFATHSLLNNQHPELSGVVLSLFDRSGRPQNGFLRLYDIYNLRLSSDLVVLSACQTALGQEIKGEGLIGLTRGFLYAGAPRVVATQWAIDDRATSEVMKRFYEGMLVRGERPAAALRAAQIAIWKSKGWEAPYYWGAFTLQGEWR